MQMVGKEKNILFVAKTDPRETSYGGQQRTHVLWEGLKSIGNVWTLIPVPRKWQEEWDDNAKVLKVCVERRYSIGWFLQRLWSHFLAPATVGWGVQLKARSGCCLLDRIRDVRFDVVVSSTLGVAGRYQLWRIAPLYIDVDDTPTTNYRRARPGNRIRLWLLKLWQNRICRKAIGLWVPDPEQKNELPGFNVSVLPNIPIVNGGLANEIRVEDGDSSRNTLLFVGYLAHEPNYVAIDWFLKTYWEVLKMKFPSLKYRIAGGGLPPHFRKAWAACEDVELVGFVDDLRTFYSSGSVFLAPMRIGSGTCLKILESLAYGKFVISTPLGLRGIPQADRVPENGIYEFVDQESLCSLIAHITRKTGEGVVANNGSEYVRQHYSQSVFNQALKDCLR